ncbi:hypothetical protein D3C75_661760 [compost metagenome]
MPFKKKTVRSGKALPSRKRSLPKGKPDSGRKKRKAIRRLNAGGTRQRDELFHLGYDKGWQNGLAKGFEDGFDSAYKAE